MNNNFYKNIYQEMYENGYKDNPSETSSSEFIDFLLSNFNFHSSLNIGCGNGREMEILKEKGKASIGIDISESAVKKCVDNGRVAAVASILDIPFSENEFDITVTSDVIEHLKEEDLIRAFNESFRVCKSNFISNISIKESNAKEKYIDLKKHGINNLHLTVRDLNWWSEFLSSNFKKHSIIRKKKHIIAIISK